MVSKSILMVSIDDLNHWATLKELYPGSVHTPNLDRLMDQGTTFSNAFAQCALCVPSRASVLSGQTVERLGVDISSRWWGDGHATEDQALHAVMKNAGFFSASTGKFQHSVRFPDYIRDLFFDAEWTDPDTTKDQRSPWWRPSGLGDAAMPDHANGTWAIDTLGGLAQTGSPFFLTYGIRKPHADWRVPQKYYDLYPVADVELPFTVAGDSADLPPLAKSIRATGFHNSIVKNGDWTDAVRGYLASISFADAMLGRVLDAVENNGLADETSIIVWSDHGYHLGDKGTWHKLSLWEEAARAPLIIADAGVGRPGQRIDQVVDLLDIYKTALDLAGLDAARVAPWAQGQSLVPLIEDPTTPSDGVAITSRYGMYSVRSDGWRYIRYPDGSEELYDIQRDPHQWRNRADDPSSAAVKASHWRELQSYFDREGVFATRGNGETVVGTGAADILVGGHKATLNGRGGDDLYLIYHSATAIGESANGGRDKALVYVDFTLPANVEDAEFIDTSIGHSIVGNAAGNVITSNKGSDVISGRGGDDRLFGSSGNDSIDGGGGNDTLSGGAGNDTLFGKAGNDLYRFEGALTDKDVVSDSSGVSDALEFTAKDAFSAVNTVARTGDDLVFHLADGGSITVKLFFAGNVIETLKTGGTEYAMNASFSGPATTLEAFLGLAPRPDLPASGDVLKGTSGKDVLVGTGAADVIDALAGNDTVDGLGGDDLLKGRAGNDILRGRAGNDRLEGGGGNDRVWGGGGDDQLNGHGGHDTLFGGEGKDTLIGGAIGVGNLENDWLDGGGGHDSLDGRGGDDVLRGRGGDDIISGGGGDDNLQGGGGRDVLRGGGGNDVLNGHGGDDRLTGQGGEDRFLFKGTFGNDTVTDFSRAQGDKLWIGTNLGVNSFDDLDTSGNGVLNGADSRVAIAGGNTIISFAGGEITALGVTNLMADDLAFF